MKRILALLLLAVFCLSGAVADTTDTETNGLPTYSIDYDELTVAVTTPMTGAFFTSMWGNGSSDCDVRAMLHGYDLVRWQVEEGMFVTDETVVSGLTVTEDETGNRTYLISLYGDLYYSDGTPITAWDYAFSILLGIAPEVEEIGGVPRTPEYILGYAEYRDGVSNTLAGVRVLADDMLSITVRGEYLPFFFELGLLDCLPYPISVIAPGVTVVDEGNGIRLANADGSDEPLFTADLLRATILDPDTGYQTHPQVVSGPYTLVSYEEGVAVFASNEYYKGDASGFTPSISKVTFLSRPQEELIPALADGSVTLINKTTSAEVIREGLTLIGSDSRFTMSNYPRTGLAFVGFNAEEGPVSDQAVRQAIALLVDKDAFTRDSVGDYGLAVTGYYGMGQWMYQILNGTLAYPVEAPTDDSAAAQTAYEEAIAEWEALSLEDIPENAADPEAAAALLDDAGWNLNADGEPYAGAEGEVRCRRTDAGLEALELRLAYPEGTSAADALEQDLALPLRAAGIQITLESVPLAEMLPQYYRMTESSYDMFFLATNFDVLFDLSSAFVTDEEGRHVWKTTGVADEQLWQLSVQMSGTTPGDLLSYCKSWLALQIRFAEIVPMIPLYSNVFFDFYPRELHEYTIAANASWPEAIVPAYLSDILEDTEVPQEEEDGIEFVG